jgi:hypothetical protein
MSYIQAGGLEVAILDFPRVHLQVLGKEGSLLGAGGSELLLFRRSARASYCESLICWPAAAMPGQHEYV